MWLPWGPPLMTPGQQVHVQVVYGLAAVRVGIDYRPISTIGVPFPLGQIRRRQGQAANNRGITDVVQRGDVVAGDDHGMKGRLGVDVPEGDHLWCLVNERCRDLASHDPTK